MAPSSASAMGRSKCDPSFGRSAGERFTVIRLGGSERPMAAMARSEEHTSELQSLMRISYAVFCLNKNNIFIKHTDTATRPPYPSITNIHTYTVSTNYTTSRLHSYELL